MKRPHLIHKWRWVKNERLTIFAMRAYYECENCGKGKTTIFP